MFAGRRTVLSDDISSHRARALSIESKKEVNSVFSLIDRGTKIEFFGAGLSIVGLRVFQSERRESVFPIGIPTGTIFEYPTSGVQDMASFGECVWDKDPTPVEFSAKGIIILGVRAVCLNMNRPQPEEQHRFSVVRPSHANVSEDLKRLLKSATLDDPFLYQAKNRVRQFAVWTITDNPPRDAYQKLVDPIDAILAPAGGVVRSLGREFHIQGGAQGRGPDKNELEEVRVMLQNASVNTSKYQAFTRS